MASLSIQMTVGGINKRTGKQFDTDIIEAFIELVSDGLCEGLELYQWR